MPKHPALTYVTILLAASLALAEELLPDPSFEKPKPRDRWGLVFADWGGWIYEGSPVFAVGQVARTGRHSCEIIGARDGKIRLQSKEIALTPGRYRLRAYLRGLDLSKGRWGTSLDFSVGFEDKWPKINRSGTFGWTPLTYVFDYPAGTTKPFRLFIGLWETGRLWIDDASLEKVDDSVAVTPQPLWGKEEAPVAPPDKLTTPVRCKECSYRNDAAWPRCYACGHELAAPGRERFTTPPQVVFADFEDGKRTPFEEGTAVAEHASHGKSALRVDRDWAQTSRPLDFSQHDYFHFDVYNPHDRAVQVYVEIRDAQTQGYWTRVNLQTVVPPGPSTVSFPTQLFVGEKSRPGRPLLRDQITRFVVAVGQDGPLFFDHFRLERLDTAGVRFEGLLAWDFGPAGSPLMEGFEPADDGVLYTAGRGFGWQDARVWRSFDARQPEALTQDFVCPESGAWRIDLPDGRYRVVMNVESPGAFWGEQQNYLQRQVRAGGKVVHEARMDVEAFQRRYFQHADTEDRPGVDPFDTYLLPTDRWLAFDANATGGKLEIAFRGENWAFCLSTMIVYPAAKAPQGEKFVRWVDQRRRFQFHNNFKQVVPRPAGAAPPEKGFRLFARHFMDPPGAKDGPREGEAIDPGKGLAVTVARGEASQVVFSLQPGKEDLGAIDLTVSPLTAGSGAKLEASAIQAGWIDYRITRVTMDGGVYDVRPRYWHRAPAPAAAGVTRTFWLRLRTPSDAVPGEYAGMLTVRPARGEAGRLPLRITVLPFALDEIGDLAVGPWGCNIPLPWLGSDPATRAWNERMFEKSLRALRQVGCTSFSGKPAIAVTARDGRITLDTARADAEMALARKLGFHHMISNYGAGGQMAYAPYGDASGPDAAAAKRAGFADVASFLKALYAKIDRHALASNWLPVAWNLCDEPIGANVAGAVKNALAHRAAGEGLKRTSFMGATSMQGKDPKDPHYPLVRALPIPSLNLHDEASIGVIRDAGGAFSFYNGSDRWTYGRYMKSLVVRHQLCLRLVWHYHVCVGDPYYALDCREDDYCWFNTNAAGEMVPSIRLLSEIQPGLNDYRYLSTLQRLLAEKPDHPAIGRAKKAFEEMMALEAGKDRPMDRTRRREGRLGEYEADRQKVADAIRLLSK